MIFFLIYIHTYTVSQQTEKQMILNRYLGSLLSIENKYRVYGYITNTNVLIVIVIKESQIRESEIRNCMTALHQQYVKYICNPFINIEEKIESKSFQDAMYALDKKYSVSMVKVPAPVTNKKGRSKSARGK